METHMCRRFAFRARFIGFLALAIMGVTNRASKSAAMRTEPQLQADFYVARAERTRILEPWRSRLRRWHRSQHGRRPRDSTQTCSY